MGVLAAFSVALVGLTNGAASGAQASSATVIVSPQGTGQVRLGMTVTALHKRHLIGSPHKGCELDPGQRVAKLRPPLEGFAVFSHPNTRLSSLAIRGGAETGKHIGIGTRSKEVLKAYPHAVYRPPGTNHPFPQGFIWINSIAHPKLTFTIDNDTHRVSEIAVPSPNICE